jgi:hypothetical protein
MKALLVNALKVSRPRAGIFVEQISRLPSQV